MNPVIRDLLKQMCLQRSGELMNGTFKENGEEIKDQIRTRSYQPNRERMSGSSSHLSMKKSIHEVFDKT